MNRITIIIFALFSTSVLSKEMVFVKNSLGIKLLVRCGIESNDQFVETIRLNQKQIKCLENKRKQLAREKSFRCGAAAGYHSRCLQSWPITSACLEVGSISSRRGASASVT